MTMEEKMSCTTVRISISDLNDTISYRAFQKYYETNFTYQPRGIYYKANDDKITITTTTTNLAAYVAYHRLYQNNNLRWHMFVVNPVPSSMTDAIVVGTRMFTVVSLPDLVLYYVPFYFIPFINDVN
jgi:hypothetical protein